MEWHPVEISPQEDPQDSKHEIKREATLSIQSKEIDCFMSILHIYFNESYNYHEKEGD